MKLITILGLLTLTGCSALPPRLSEQAFRQALPERQYQSLGTRGTDTALRVYLNDRPTGITLR